MHRSNSVLNLISLQLYKYMAGHNGARKKCEFYLVL